MIACGHHELDIASENEVESLFESTAFDLVVNCAAYTAVDKAETEEKQAYAVNALGAKNLALCCKKYDRPLIHISTDYVYDNGRSRVHTEDEPVNTRCVYGKTKLFGEKFISDSKCRYVILRASWIFGRYGKNFVKAMLNLASTRDALKVVSDELGNPTPARALAYDICAIIEQMLKPDFDQYGIYNYCGKDEIVRCDFAVEILRIARSIGLLDHDVQVGKITSEEFGAPAKRPSDSRMSTDKFEKAFSLKAPRWADYIEETLRG